MLGNLRIAAYFNVVFSLLSQIKLGKCQYINVQRSYKISLNIVKPLMNYQQEISGLLYRRALHNFGSNV